MTRLPPIHPGETLREDYLPDLGLTASALAERTGLSVEHVERIIAEREGVTPEVAARLGRAFGQSPQFWTNLQAAFDRGGARPD